MKKIKFKTEFVKTKHGWSRWIDPVMKGYLMKCCDCGLVHEMDFKTYLIGKYKGDRIGTELPDTFKVSFRARRRKSK